MAKRAEIAYLCDGPYPSIEEQVRALRGERDAPDFPERHYVDTVVAVNRYLVGLIVQRFCWRTK